MYAGITKSTNYFVLIIILGVVFAEQLSNIISTAFYITE